MLTRPETSSVLCQKGVVIYFKWKAKGFQVKLKMGVNMHDYSKVPYKEGVHQGSQNQQMRSSSSLPSIEHKKDKVFGCAVHILSK